MAEPDALRGGPSNTSTTRRVDANRASTRRKEQRMPDLPPMAAAKHRWSLLGLDWEYDNRRPPAFTAGECQTDPEVSADDLTPPPPMSL